MTNRLTFSESIIQAGKPLDEQLFNIIRQNDQNHEERISAVEQGFGGGGASFYNGIISSQTSTISSRPDFIRADGSTNEVTVLSTTTSLVIDSNGTETTYSSDIVKTGLNSAPATNNTCFINDAALDGSEFTKYIGEESTVLTVDAMLSNISAKIGTVQTFKSGSGVFRAFVKSTTELSSLQRGIFRDSTGARVARVVLNNNDSIEILETSYLFGLSASASVVVNNNGTLNSIPASPAQGDCYFDTTFNTYKIYDSTTWKDCAPLGYCAVDSSGLCIASVSYNKLGNFSSLLTTEFSKLTDTQVAAHESSFQVSVYGTQYTINSVSSIYAFDITTDLPSPEIEAVSTEYFLYMGDDQSSVITSVRPVYYNEMQGYYHPTESWRCVAFAWNDAAGNLQNYFIFEGTEHTEIFVAASEIVSIGGGGATRSAKGLDSFFNAGTTSLIKAYGGGSGTLQSSDAPSTGGVGGSATGGDINLRGQDGSGTSNKGGDAADISIYIQDDVLIGGEGGAAVAGTKYGGGGGESLFGTGGGAGACIKSFDRASLPVPVVLTPGLGATPPSGPSGADGCCAIRYIFNF